MSIEPIGILTAFLGIGSIVLGLNAGAYILCISALLGAAAAVLLPALGNASVQPFHFVLAFLIVGVALRPGIMTVCLRSLSYPGPGFWYAIFVLYSILTAMFLPRIFSGATVVYALARGNDIRGIVMNPLAPSTSNVTQAVYMLGSLCCFAISAGISRLGGFETFARALILTAGLCVFFAIADIATYMTGTAYLLDPIRNANYRMLDDGAIEGFKRIVGSYTEAGAFGYAALALFAFLLMLKLEGFHSRFLGWITAALAIALLLCTSTTAYVATGVTCLIVLGFCAYRVLQLRATSRHMIYVGTCVVILPLLIMAIMLIPAASDTVGNLIHATMTTKLDSQSGEERMRWNSQAMITFFDTGGLGAGLGSVRASSFVVALFANVGVLGAIIFFLFFLSLVRWTLSRRNATALEAAVGSAALLSCIAQFVASSITAGSVDLGPLFAIAAGLAAGYGLGPIPIRSAETPFRKGQLPANSASLRFPVGAGHLTVDGYQRLMGTPREAGHV